MASQDLLNPEDDLTSGDQDFWNGLMDKVKLGDTEKPSDLVEVAPKPIFCVKTKNKEGEKVFMNICTCDQIPEPK